MLLKIFFVLDCFDILWSSIWLLKVVGRVAGLIEIKISTILEHSTKSNNFCKSLFLYVSL